ncbi:hypothetical protein [Novosphingobium sp.]|uniref:hypothetical protein n=1 Tax=Novosphingobium sp. TaxID=1874826 RepID=UPI0025F57005|nr:hypothetical protein [Novosphingobium sp.]
MKSLRPIALNLILASMASCTTLPQTAHDRFALTGAALDADGMASIGKVPASPWPSVAPPEPGASETGGEIYAREAPPAQVEADARYPFHLFPRSKSAATIVLTSATYGTVLLDHGCFRRADRKGKPGNLVLFDRNAQIGRDSQGYLAVFDSGKPSARVGEPAIWGGYPGANERDPDVRKLREVCGEGPIDAVGIPSSVRLFSLPYPEWVANYARVKKISYQAAWDRAIACMKRREADGTGGLEARDSCIDQYN